MNLEEAVLEFRLNESKFACVHYQNENIRERPEDWVPFVATISGNAKVKLLTTYL